MTTYTLDLLQHFILFSLNFTCPSQYSCNDHKTKTEIICIYIQDEGMAVTEKFYFNTGLQEFKNLSAFNGITQKVKY